MWAFLMWLPLFAFSGVEKTYFDQQSPPSSAKQVPVTKRLQSHLSQRVNRGKRLAKNNFRLPCEKWGSLQSNVSWHTSSEFMTHDMCISLTARTQKKKSCGTLIPQKPPWDPWGVMAHHLRNTSLSQGRWGGILIFWGICFLVRECMLKNFHHTLKHIIIIVVVAAVVFLTHPSSTEL